LRGTALCDDGDHAGKLSPRRAVRTRKKFLHEPRTEMIDLETQLKAARDKVAQLYARWHELELLQSVPSA